MTHFAKRVAHEQMKNALIVQVHLNAQVQKLIAEHECDK